MKHLCYRYERPKDDYFVHPQWGPVEVTSWNLVGFWCYEDHEGGVVYEAKAVGYG